jgi:cytochrome c biogenesis protein CcdA
MVVVYLGGVLTIIGPCILRVLPFIFALSSDVWAQRLTRAHRHGGHVRGRAPIG